MALELRRGVVGTCCERVDVVDALSDEVDVSLRYVVCRLVIDTAAIPGERDGMFLLLCL